jgi:beta-glucanase (GH16 family)
LTTAVVGLGNLTQASVVTDNPAGWTLTFEDEFAGSALDSSKWGYRQLGPRHDGINATSAVTVADGALTIKTYTDGGVHYTGMIGTQDKFEQTYGYYEARMKFHTTPGQWSAFWLQSPDYGGLGNPAVYGTEIDIVEHRAINRNGVDFRARYNSAVHWDGYEDAHQQTARPHTGLAGLSNDTWHTYGLKWSESGYEFYFDDQLIWTVTEPVSKRPEYMILSSEIRNNNWAGNIPAGGYASLATSVTNVQVDYVRAYSAVTPAPESADFDTDGDVDGADFLIWQRGVGTTAGANRSAGNANAGADGDVDAADLAVWREQFAAGGALAAAIPEPAGLASATAAVAASALARRWPPVKQLRCKPSGSP